MRGFRTGECGTGILRQPIVGSGKIVSDSVYIRIGIITERNLSSD